MTTAAAIVEFESVSKSFGGVQALREVSFAISRGEVHALAGENGAGKSTLIRICGGIFAPDSGTIRLNGVEARFHTALESRQAGISIVHQEIPVCPDLSAAENIFLGQRLPRQGGLVNWAAVNRRAQQLFDRLQVSIRPSARVADLPIAQQQIVTIAQALSHEAKLLIMDEPTSALNKHETEHLFEIIRQLKAQGLTIVYVSHRMEEVFEIADQISVLRDGRYIDTLPRAEATPERVVQLMVGREVLDMFPRSAAVPSQEVLLGVRGLAVPGVFEEVSFDLHGGEVLGLVGLQGSGTSEVLRALFGQYPDCRGEITVRGSHVKLRSALEAIRAGVAYVPADRQAEGLFRAMSVRDNIGMLRLSSLAGIAGLIASAPLSRLAQAAVQRFNIRTASINSIVSSLSGGNQQKVVIARSLSTQPLVILLDDPTRGIDVGAKAEVHQILNNLTAQGCGVILVSSELPEALAMSDRVVVMYRGRVQAVLPRAQADHEFVMQLATGSIAPTDETLAAELAVEEA